MKLLKTELRFTIFIIMVVSGCDDLSSFSTSEDEAYMGNIIQAEEVRKGFFNITQIELTLNISDIDADAGTLRVTSINENGREEVIFDDTALKPIISMKFDSLGSMDFPTGRLKNYIFNAAVTGGEHSGVDAFVIVSLMSDGNVEVRIISGEERLYGIFSLTKEKK